MDNLNKALLLVYLPNYQYTIEIDLKELSHLIQANYKSFIGLPKATSMKIFETFLIDSQRLEYFTKNKLYLKIN
jgi:hypothetical protein